MLENAQGIVLRTRPLTETSLIVHWLTRESGRLATVAKGARRPKSPFLGKLDLFYAADLSFRRSRHSELHTLAEVKLLNTYAALRRDIALLRQASYCVELLELITESETPIPGHYDAVVEFLGRIIQGPAQARNVLALEFRFLDESGLMPHVRDSGLSMGAAKGALMLAEGSWSLVQCLRLTRDQEREIARYLWFQWDSQWPRPPRARVAALGFENPMS